MAAGKTFTDLLSSPGVAPGGVRLTDGVVILRGDTGYPATVQDLRGGPPIFITEEGLPGEEGRPGTPGAAGAAGAAGSNGTNGANVNPIFIVELGEPGEDGRPGTPGAAGAAGAAGSNGTNGTNAVPIISVLAGNESRTSTIAFTNTLLSVTLVAGKNYLVTLHAQGTFAAAGGIKLDFNGGSATFTLMQGFSQVGGIGTSTSTSLALAWNALTGGGNGITGICAFPTQGTAVAGTYAIQGIMKVNAGGTLIVRMCQNASSGTASLLLAGAVLTALQLD